MRNLFFKFQNMTVQARNFSFQILFSKSLHKESNYISHCMYAAQSFKISFTFHFRLTDNMLNKKK